PRIRAVLEEEREIDGDEQAFPFGVGEVEVGHQTGVAGYALIFRPCPAAEEQGAGIAGAHQLALGQLDQVGMLGAQLRAAQFTLLEVPSWLARELPQTLEGLRRVAYRFR